MKVFLKLIVSVALISCAYGQCPKFNQVCTENKWCGDDGKAITDGTHLVSRLNVCPEGTKCCELPDDEIKATKKPFTGEAIIDLQCGFRGSDNPNRMNDTMSRVLGPKEETETDVGEFPWMILISRKNGGARDLNGLFSTGSLIHFKVVLTTAHTLKKEKADNLKAIAGNFNIASNQGLLKIQDRDVEKIIKHDEFDKESYHNNIALLILIKPFDQTNYIDILCLPPQGFDFVGKQCIVSGWGKDIFGKETKNQQTMKQIELKVIARPLCQTQFLATGQMNDYWRLHETFICAGGQINKDSCAGDGGAPLICRLEGGKEDQYHQAGIVAWGIGCGKKDHPGLYTNVAFFTDWINSQLPK